MATPDINDAFVDQFESEIKVAYQQMSSLLRDKVRVKSVTGDSTTFQNLGKGTAASKSRHGNVPVLNLQHTPVTASMADYYAGEYIDKLDELKIQHDERGGLPSPHTTHPIVRDGGDFTLPCSNCADTGGSCARPA